MFPIALTDDLNKTRVFHIKALIALGLKGVSGMDLVGQLGRSSADSNKMEGSKTHAAAALLSFLVMPIGLTGCDGPNTSPNTAVVAAGPKIEPPKGKLICEPEKYLAADQVKSSEWAEIICAPAIMLPGGTLAVALSDSWYEVSLDPLRSVYATHLERSRQLAATPADKQPAALAGLLRMFFIDVDAAIREQGVKLPIAPNHASIALASSLNSALETWVDLGALRPTGISPISLDAFAGRELKLIGSDGLELNFTLSSNSTNSTAGRIAIEINGTQINGRSGFYLDELSSAGVERAVIEARIANRDPARDKTEIAEKLFFSIINPPNNLAVGRR